MPAKKTKKKSRRPEKAKPMRVSAGTLAADRKARPKKYPLRLAERRLQNQWDYVKRHGGKLPR